MQIKRRLNALAKRMNPEIETMNRVLSFNETIDAMEQAVDYCESKIERRNLAEKTGETAAARTTRQAREEQEEALRLQDAERKEFDDDQQQRAAQPDEAGDAPIVIEGQAELEAQPGAIGTDRAATDAENEEADAGSEPAKTK